MLDNKIIRVLLADDHKMVRKNVQALLSREKDISVVGTAADGQEALQLTEVLAPDIVIMDITMPKLDGIQSTEQIKKLTKPSKVIILSMHTNKQVVEQAMKVGASGYVPKKSVVQDLITAVRAVNDGQTFISNGLQIL